MIVACGLLIVSVLPRAGAHPDPPGEGHYAAVSLTSVEFSKFLERPEDGPDGNAEISVDITTNHAGHALENKVVSSNVVKLGRGDLGKLFWTPEELVYEHDECSPRAGITVGGTVWEEDVTAAEDVGIGATAGVFGLLFTPLTGLAIGIGAGVLANLDGNDDYGTFSGPIPESDFADLSTVGGDLPVTLHLFGSSRPKPEVACTSPSPSPSPTPTPTPTPPSAEEQTGFLFDPMQEALATVGDIRVETGNPGGLTPARLDSVADTYASFVTGLAELAAGAEIELSRHFSGTETAVESFETAQTFRDEDPLAALELYRSAFASAAQARDEGTPGGQATLPWQVSLTPRVIATNKGDTTYALISLFGAGATSEMTVQAPDGIEVTLTPFETFLPMYAATIDLTGATPGKHSVVFTAVEGPGTVEGTLELRVGPASPPRCGGLAPTMVGMPGDQTIRGTPRRDVIVARRGNDVIRGRGGNDVLCGGAGRDRLLGGDGDDRLFGQGDNDELVGGGGRDECTSGPGRDRVLVGGDSGCEDFS